MTRSPVPIGLPLPTPAERLRSPQNRLRALALVIPRTPPEDASGQETPSEQRSWGRRMFGRA
jgi:hypothetical protein